MLTLASAYGGEAYTPGFGLAWQWQSLYKMLHREITAD